MWIHILISLLGILNKQLDDFIKLSKTNITENTNLLLGPETVLQEMIWENKIDTYFKVLSS